MPCACSPGSTISYLLLFYLSYVVLYSDLLSSHVVFYVLILYFSFVLLIVTLIVVNFYPILKPLSLSLLSFNY